METIELRHGLSVRGHIGFGRSTNHDSKFLPDEPSLIYFLGETRAVVPQPPHASLLHDVLRPFRVFSDASRNHARRLKYANASKSTTAAAIGCQKNNLHLN